MGDNGGWRRRAALAETWGALAEACYELSATEWALPTECPGWDVKDQLSHLIGIERSLMGEAAPAVGRPARATHVRNDVAAMNERWVAVRRPLPGARRPRRVRRGDPRPAWPSWSARTEDEWAAVGWSPVGEVPYAVFMEVRVFDSWVHEQDARRALDRPGGSGNRASALSLDRVQGAMPFVVGKQAGCPEARRSASTSRARGATRGPSRSPSRAVGPGPSGDEVRPDGHPLAVGHRLHTPRLRPGHGGTGGGRRRRSSWRGTRRSARRVLGAMNFMF